MMSRNVGRTLVIQLLILPVLLLWSCGGASKTSRGADETWSIPGTPVVKLVRTAPGEMAALTERHICCFTDHPRQVVLLRHGSSEIEELEGAAREGELVTDIAPGPDSGSLWILATKWNVEAKVFEPRLGLFAGSARKSEVASFALEPASFTGIDTMAPTYLSFQYDPELDTHDVLRLAAQQELVSVVGRNATSTAYVDRYRYTENHLVRSGRAVLAPPFRGMRWSLNGGSYDVFGWTQNAYRVHAAMAEDGTLYGAVTVGMGGLNDIDTFWGTNWVARLGIDPFGVAVIAMVFTVSPDAEVTPLEAQLVGLGREDSALLLTLSVAGERRVLSGLSREGPEGRSFLVLTEIGAARRVIASTHGSAALQAVAVDASGNIFGGGSWDWTQNPAGLSISDGYRFLSQLPAEGETWPEVNLLTPGLARSEVRSILAPANGIACVGGMDNGPDTHRADSDPSLIEGDGFVECLDWDGNE